jgi:hypothetical protein
MVRLVVRVLRAIKAVVLLTLLFVKTVVFRHGLGLRTLFAPTLSQVRPPRRIRVRYLDKLQFKILMALRCFMRDPLFAQAWWKRVHASLLRQVRAQAGDPADLVQPVLTIAPEEFSPRIFFERHVKAGMPVVIKGGALHTEALREWSVAAFRERIPEVELKIADLNTGRYRTGTLREVIDSQGTSQRLYVRNATDLFRAHPELLDELNCEEFARQMGGRGTMFTGVQLFLGVHATTGTDFHCANNLNLFYQIEGRKLWRFVHPEHSWMMYPLMNRHLMFCASNVRREFDAEYLREHFPLYEYCPRQEVVLEPGDILINPPWQWHEIENISERSIAVSTRWFSRRLPLNNRLFDLLQFLSPLSYYLKFLALTAEPGRMMLLDDETNMKLVSSGDDDYVGFGKQGSSGAADPRNWRKDQRF